VNWQYIDADPRLIGFHFLAFNAGYLFAAAFAQGMLRRWATGIMVSASFGLASASLLTLSLVAPPVAIGWRMMALAFAGIASGGLLTSLLYGLDAGFSRSTAAMAKRAGLLFGSGCMLSTLVVALTYFTHLPALPTLLLAAVPMVFLLLFLRNRGVWFFQPHVREEDASRETLKDLRSIAALLFSLLLFFQFGNEWAIAGWLPLFLIHRLGSNPVLAVCTLGAYFLALMIGRLGAQKLLPRIDHRRLLVGSMGIAMLGYLLLSLTDSLGGGWIAVLIIGAGYAPIYPLIAQKLDDRFSYHPAFYNGTVSIAMTGAMCFPWLLGYVDSYFGMRFVILLPALGSIVVVILALLLMLEAHLMTGKGVQPARSG